MRAFTCGVCGQLVFFENSACLRCGTKLGVRWSDRELVTKPDQPPCANRDAIGCNGLADAPGALCFACGLTRTRPNAADGHGVAQWAEAERAKRRLVFELGELGLPIPTRQEQPDGGLAFDLLSSAVAAGDHRPRRRADHARPRRVRRRPARAPAGPDGRALPDAARAHAPRGRPLLLPAADRQRGGADDRARGSSATSARTTRRRWIATTPMGRRRAGRASTSAPTRRCTRPRTGPRPSPTSSTCATRCRPRRPTACASTVRRAGRTSTPSRSTPAPAGCARCSTTGSG